MAGSQLPAVGPFVVARDVDQRHGEASKSPAVEEEPRRCKPPAVLEVAGVDDQAGVLGGDVIEHPRQFAAFVIAVRGVADHGEAPGFGAAAPASSRPGGGKQLGCAGFDGLFMAAAISARRGRRAPRAASVDRDRSNAAARSPAWVGGSCASAALASAVAKRSGCRGLIDARCSNSRNCRRAAFSTAEGIPASAAT
jgi:hypothetical protein